MSGVEPGACRRSRARGPGALSWRQTGVVCRCTFSSRPSRHRSAGSPQVCADHRAAAQLSLAARESGCADPVSGLGCTRLAPAVAVTPEDEEALDVARSLLQVLGAGRQPSLDLDGIRRFLGELAPLLPELLPGFAYTSALMQPPESSACVLFAGPGLAFLMCVKLSVASHLAGCGKPEPGLHARVWTCVRFGSGPWQAMNNI